jgi:hypothetical protein
MNRPPHASKRTSYSQVPAFSCPFCDSDERLKLVVKISERIEPARQS